MGKRDETRPRSYKYSFRLNEEQNLRFGRMLTEAGSEENRSRFIVGRIFGKEFVVVRRDPSKTEFVARLNDFYYQFQRIGNNYNQVFSSTSIPRQVATLEQRTSELITRPSSRSELFFLLSRFDLLGLLGR